MRAVMLNEHYFLLSMVTSAGIIVFIQLSLFLSIVTKPSSCLDLGAYVKEFVHGDLGRTRPSISSIFGCEVKFDSQQLQYIYLSDLDNNTIVA
jgi:hypothetical protein